MRDGRRTSKVRPAAPALPPAIRGRFGGDAVEVTDVQPGTPAERAGMRTEDLILSVNTERVTSVLDLQRMMVAELIGVSVSIQVLRGGDVVRLELVPEELSL